MMIVLAMMANRSMKGMRKPSAVIARQVRHLLHSGRTEEGFGFIR